MRTRLNKRCPRCETKMPAPMRVCPNCQLNFNKFEEATNLEGKRALAMGEKDRVIYRKGCPKDVSKIKLLLLTIFLGFVGVHHYYVGKKWWGLFYTFFFVVGVVNAIIGVVFKVTPTGDLWQLFTLLVMVWGVVLVMWLFDILNVIFNKYRIPVSLERK